MLDTAFVLAVFMIIKHILMVLGTGATSNEWNVKASIWLIRDIPATAKTMPRTVNIRIAARTADLGSRSSADIINTVSQVDMSDLEDFDNHISDSRTIRDTFLGGYKLQDSENFLLECKDHSSITMGRLWFSKLDPMIDNLRSEGFEIILSLCEVIHAMRVRIAAALGGGLLEYWTDTAFVNSGSMMSIFTSADGDGKIFGISPDEVEIESEKFCENDYARMKLSFKVPQYALSSIVYYASTQLVNPPPCYMADLAQLVEREIECAGEFTVIARPAADQDVCEIAKAYVSSWTILQALVLIKKRQLTNTLNSGDNMNEINV